MAELEKYMATYEGDDMKKISSLLTPKEKEHILIVHDECIFYLNDGKCGIQAKSGELPLRKKGNGKSIMNFSDDRPKGIKQVLIERGL